MSASLTIATLDALIAARDPAMLVDRVHPRFGTHAQANHRWSTTDPPLAQYPEALEEILDLDDGWFEWGADADQQERRIIAAVAQDEVLLDILARGYDAHTLDTCDVFDLPKPPDMKDPHNSPLAADWRAAIGWKGKKDKRRVMGKNYFFALCYGKQPKNMMEIPGAKAFGLSPKRFEAAALRTLRRYPGIKRWQQRIHQQCQVRPVSRTFLGSRRYSHLRGNELYRAMLDHPIQAAAADMMNLIIVQIHDALSPKVSLRWTKHDFMSWNVKDELITGPTLCRMAEIAEQEWDAWGVKFRVPVTCYVRRKGQERQVWARPPK